MEHYFHCSGNVANANPLVMPPQSQVETQSSQASSFDTKTKLSMTRKRSNPNVILVEIIDVGEEAKSQKKNTNLLGNAKVFGQHPFLGHKCYK
jgi:hypothetical protein